MAKIKTQFVCRNCGRRTPRFIGRCPKCHEFDTMEEEVIQEVGAKAKRNAGISSNSTPVRLPNIKSSNVDRMVLPLTEFSRVLGGGIVPGSLILLGGDPGIGKSTLLLDVAALVANHHGRTLYISGEESAHQIKMRADRMGIKANDLFLVTETNLETMLYHIEQTNPKLVIVDSIQTTNTADLKSAAGSVTQIRECATRFQDLAKRKGVPVFLVGHVTKDGTIAGPRVLEHIVDTVLYLAGDPFHRYRLLRSVKNRFGATNEVGVFEMLEKGMVEVTNPSEAFLAERQINAPGSAITIPLEGTRPLLVEIQALASETAFPNPRRTANGVDYNRLLLVTAVLTKRVRAKLFDKDIFINVVGGLDIDEPAADVAVAIANASSLWDRPIHADMAFIGEVGLSGELRAVSQLNLRLREAAKLGFKRCVVPKSSQRKGATFPKGIEIIGCRSLHDVLNVALIAKK